MPRRCVIAAAVMAAAWPLAAGAELWDGPKLKPVPRQEVYEFTRPPVFARTGPDRYEIRFASKGFCDVAVCVEDAAGRIVRHLVYGVLGPNAPTPLKANSLDQAVAWDGKDDLGKYVRDPQECQARVSLGLNPTFDRIIGWHPKDTIGLVSGLGAGPSGVFVANFTGNYWIALRVFNHDGSYQRTLMPFRADKWPTIKGGWVRQPVPGEDYDVPARDGKGVFYPFGVRGAASINLVEANGQIVWPYYCYGAKPGLYRIGVDGSSQAPVIGPPVFTDREGAQMWCIGAIAASPDGKQVYLTRLVPKLPSVDPYARFDLPRGSMSRMPNRRHAVFRIGWDQAEPLAAESFVGEVTEGTNNKGADKDNAHLDNPEDVAVDAAGRVYVADCNNNRVQVFSPDAKHLKTIPVPFPHKLAVHHRTGEVYVLSYPWRSAQATLRKFSAMPECRPLAETPVSDGKGEHAVTPLALDEGETTRASFAFALDGWTAPAQAWLALGTKITRWADRGDRFELLEDFDETVRKAGYTPHAFNGYKMNRISADPVRGDLYYLNSLGRTLLRCDPQVGKAWDRVRSPLHIDDFQVGADGLLYLRDMKAIARMDPTALGRDGQGMPDALVREIPFDYGEELADGYDDIRVWAPGRKLKGVIRVPALVPGNGFNMGFGVNHRGHTVALCMNFHQGFKSFDPRFTSLGVWSPPPEDRYRPAIFPGRTWLRSQVVFAWDEKGQIIGEDIVKATNYRNSGVKLDRDDNVYVSLAAYPVLGDHAMVSACGGENGPGALLKFPLTGGKIFGDWGEPVKLDKFPDRPPEYIAGWGTPAVRELKGGDRLWTENLLWSYPGLGTERNCNACICPGSRFDVDTFGRCFIPESWRFTVGVCDTNGNPVTHIGRYGNTDSGRGPDSPIPVPGGIAFSNTDYLCTVTDRWLYVNDAGNWRVVRIKLGYHAERRAKIVE